MQWLCNMFWICDTCPSTNDRRLLVFLLSRHGNEHILPRVRRVFLMGMKMLYSCMQTHVLVKCVYMCVCTRVYVYVCVYILYIYIFVYVNMYMQVTGTVVGLILNLWMQVCKPAYRV